MKQFFFACAAFLFVFLTGSGCKKASVTEQPALPVNVVTVVEKEVNEWNDSIRRRAWLSDRNVNGTDDAKICKCT